MADQSSLASILAALSQAQAAQQRQSGGNLSDSRPAPPMQQQLGATNSGGAMGNSYGYPPPPSSSGAIDLSTLKPSNSGSMSFADPRFGASGLNSTSPMMSSNYYDQGRNGGYDDSRRRRRSRSRSGSRERSPYGYRRRDRERSYSPPRRGGGSSPDRDTMVIDVAFVGLIIGRGGETLRRLENDTGARVQFVPDEARTAKFRTCHITGTSSQVRAARRALQFIINENLAAKTAQGKTHGTPSIKTTPSEGQISVQINVPDPTVGLVIGKGGDTIKDLQDRSGCHINIVDESQSSGGLRPVNLIGSDAAIKRAQKLIEEIVNSDTNGKPRISVTSDVAGSSVQVTEVISVPMDSVGMIIGKGGETVKEMQHNTQCKINVSSQYSPSDPTRDITLSGSPETIRRAKEAIQEKIEAVNLRKQSMQSPPQNTGSQYNNSTSAATGTNSFDASSLANLYGAAGTGPSSSSTPTNNQADPYAAYGGYQNYVAMWQQWYVF